MKPAKEKKKLNPGIKTALVILLVVVVSIVFIYLASWSGIEYAKSYQDEKAQGYFVSIWSAVLGGFCTLAGVVITIIVSFEDKKRKTKEDNKPELFAPGRYDAKEAVRVFMTDGGQNKTSANCRAFLKNSDKAPVIIESINVNGTVYLPKTVFYIEKENLFCIAFYLANYNGWIGEKYRLIVRSVDNHKYLYTVTVKNRNTWIEEDEDNVSD